MIDEDLRWIREPASGYSEPVKGHKDLRVYQESFQLASAIYQLTLRLPDDENFGLVSQARRSSRSVCANLAEAWRKRRYRAAFVAKLSDAESEAGETQVWLEFVAATWPELSKEAEELWPRYETLIGSIVGMIHYADKWGIR